MASQCFQPIKGRVFRMTRLDECGTPVVGASSVVANGFISIGGSLDYEDGEEFTRKDAWGDLCLNEKDCPALKRLNLDLMVCTIDPEAVEIAAGNRLITEAGDSIGFFGSEDRVCSGFSLEVWQKAKGPTCDPLTPTWAYWLFPWVTNTKIGDVEIANSPLEFSMTAETAGSGAQAGTLGPYDTLPVGNLLTATDHYALFLSATQPPAATCGAGAYVAP